MPYRPMKLPPQLRNCPPKGKRRRPNRLGRKAGRRTGHAVRRG